MGYKSLGSHTFPISLLALFAALAGCGDPEKIDLAPKPVFDIANKSKPPEFGEATSIQLKNGPDALKVGDDVAASLGFFAKPKKAYEFRDLPNVFPPEFKSNGWENDVEGYGLISFDNRVAAAMRLLHKVDEARVQNEITSIRYQSGRETETVTGRAARYWFWESGRHRQMVCAVPEGKDTFLLTIAIGELNTMNALRMNQRLAEADTKRADRAPTPPTE